MVFYGSARLVVGYYPLTACSSSRRIPCGTPILATLQLFLSSRSRLQRLRLRFRELWKPARSNRTYLSYATLPSSAIPHHLPTCPALQPSENLPVLPVPTPKLIPLCFVLSSTGVVIPVQFQSCRIQFRFGTSLFLNPLSRVDLPVQFQSSPGVSRAPSRTVQFRFGTSLFLNPLSRVDLPVQFQSSPGVSCAPTDPVQFRLGTIRSRPRFLSGPPGPVPVQSRCYLHLKSSPVPAWNPFRIFQSSSGLEQSVPGFLALPCVITCFAFPVQFWDYPNT
ncbi:hypothetical protein SKAU_G00323020 [Synaphobranchus kaupii]|uniref:Uncharacterized protein n=1 Tax=Synaphobranchus kaupii TaxID=118154 RepID=A0A9Q1IK31_SYNKA|nr:hypothetical protein SKAU_G00323020 [Synaphobranchus kaupii]